MNKSILYALASISFMIFCLSLLDISKNYNTKSYYIKNFDPTQLKGFEDTALQFAEDAKKLLVKFENRITELKQSADENKKRILLINFIVTMLAAGCTLISSIKAAKYENSIPKNIVIFIAVITFISTIASWSEGKLNETQTTLTAKLQSLKENRLLFFLSYSKEQDASKKESLIQEYEIKLQDI